MHAYVSSSSSDSHSFTTFFIMDLSTSENSSHSVSSFLTFVFALTKAVRKFLMIDAFVFNARLNLLVSFLSDWFLGFFCTCSVGK